MHTKWTHQQWLKDSLFFPENFLQQKKDKRTIRREIQVNSVTKNSGYSGRHSKEVWDNEKHSDNSLAIAFWEFEPPDSKAISEIGEMHRTQVFVLFFKYLEDNYITILWWLLLYINMNQP